MDQSSLVKSETALRRTFAIISHPDAGKTTLTEKLLLYSGMIRTAGMVRGRKGAKAASSDWMAMEQERGISITASAMQFTYKGVVINVLDTPGHQDFSEDTYRTLTAADCVVMVIDAAKGVETQTKKLFAVCKMRGIPVLTFINKMDLPSLEPLALLQEVEEVLGMKAAPLNWPIGSGKDFVGVADCQSKMINLFKKTSVGGAQQAQMTEVSLTDAKQNNLVAAELLQKLDDDLELLEIAGNPYSREAFLAGDISPTFFGSALTNFGVEPFFDAFIKIAPTPRVYKAKAWEDGTEYPVDPVSNPFSGFIFKIQANMNPRHRDSIAFFRVCSGEFGRDMVVTHHRLRKEVRLAHSHSMMARERNTLDSAFPGDIVGVTNTGAFAIGDTISLEGGFDFEQMPQFPPEVIAQVRPADVGKRKAFDKGMKQLAAEGAVQILFSRDSQIIEPYVAAVGKLQFDVLQYRLQDEYGVKTSVNLLPHNQSAWLVGNPDTFRKPSSALLVKDIQDRVVVLFTNAWEKRYAGEQNPSHQLVEFVK